MNMPKPDQFANLLAGFTSGKKDTSKMSLVEIQELSSKNSPLLNSSPNLSFSSLKNQWTGFGILSNTGSKNSTPSHSTNDLFEGFDNLNSSQTSKPTQPQQAYHNENLFEGFSDSTAKPSSSTTYSGPDLLDGLGFEASSVSQPLTSFTQPTQSSTQNMDDIFAIFDKPIQPKPADSKPVQSQPQPSFQESSASTNGASNEASNEFSQPVLSSRPSRPSTELFFNDSAPSKPSRRKKKAIDYEALDEAIASLVDMGFSVEQANDALSHTSTGTDVQEAISYIMTKAHNTSRKKSGLAPEPKSQKSSQKKTDQYFQSFSSLVSKATTDLTNKFFQPPSNDGKPAWMRDQTKQKARTKYSYEEEPEELTSEAIERLSLESERKSASIPRKPISRKKKNPFSKHPQHMQIPGESESEPEFEPTPESKSEDVIDLFAPLPTKPQASEPIVDLFSSPASSVSSKINGSGFNEMRSRRKATPRSTPSASSTPKITRAAVFISQTQLEFFHDSRKQGGVAFKNGDFTTALTHYQTALNTLPPNHILRVIAYSNVIVAYYKIGEYKRAVDLANEAITLIGQEKGQGEEVEAGKPMKDFWIKITQRKAESLEHMEKFKESLETWNELIENGSANKISLDGKRRCQKVLDPQPKQARASSSAQSFEKAIPKTASKVATPQNSDALRNLQKATKESESFEEEKFRLKDQIDDRINRWKNGKDDNLRALLASLQDILWPAANWKTVGMSDLVMPKKVKIIYLKAVAKVHPDKIPKDATSEQKIIAESVFVVINQAWESFKSANGLQ